MSSGRRCGGRGLSAGPAGYFFAPCLTKRMHCPWFLKPNRFQPPCLHWSLVVGTRATGLTATSLGPWPVATVGGLLGESSPPEPMSYWDTPARQLTAFATYPPSPFAPTATRTRSSTP